VQLANSLKKCDVVSKGAESSLQNSISRKSFGLQSLQRARTVTVSAQRNRFMPKQNYDQFMNRISILENLIRSTHQQDFEKSVGELKNFQDLSSNFESNLRRVLKAQGLKESIN